MLVSELMEYPKIKALMEKYWDNDIYSGIWGGREATEYLTDAFIWDVTEEGYGFWDDLFRGDLDTCKNKYPEYFTKEEETPTNTSVDIGHLRKWPKLYDRASYILSRVEGCNSLGEAVNEYYQRGLAEGFTTPDPYWEGIIFWGRVMEGDFEAAANQYPNLFEGAAEETKPTKTVPILGLRESKDGTKAVNVLGYKKENTTSLSLASVLLSQEGEYNGHGQLSVNHELSLEEALQLATEVEELLDGNLVYCQFYTDGSGSMNIGNYWRSVEDSPSGTRTDKMIFSWGG